MKRFTLTKSLAAAGLVLGALGAASTAHARSDVYFSVGVQSPGVYVHPAPFYAQPRPVYVAPQPVYVAPRSVYSEPQSIYTPGYHGRHEYEDDRGRYDSHAWQRRGPYGDHDHDGDGIANVYDPDSPRNQRRWARLYGPYGDLDRDGIMNRDDRDRDGDGIRNRHDRFPDDPYRN